MINKAMLFEQMKSLALFYPADRVKIENSQIIAWWPIFKNFDPEDMIQGIIACRRENNRRFPSAGILENCVLSAEKIRKKNELNVRVEKHEKTKNEVGAMPGISDAEINSEAGDAIRVIQFYLSTGMKTMSAEKMRELSKKHPGNKNGFMRLALQFENLQ